MSIRHGFDTMGDVGEAATGVPTIGIGMLGYAFMGKAHTNAYKTLDYIYTPPPAHPRLVAIAGRSRERVEAAAFRYGYEKAVTDWHEIVQNPDVQVFDNSAPNGLHAEPTIAAAQAGKHVICEKPLGRNAEESKRILETIEEGQPELALSIRNLMFTFEDLVTVPPATIREIVSGVDKRQLAMALRGAKEELRAQIFKAMSSRAVEMLKEDMEVMGPVRSREVAAAQQEILNLARSLEAEGKVILKMETGDEMMA